MTVADSSNAERGPTLPDIAEPVALPPFEGLGCGEMERLFDSDSVICFAEIEHYGRTPLHVRLTTLF